MVPGTVGAAWEGPVVGDGGGGTEIRGGGVAVVVGGYLAALPCDLVGGGVAEGV